MSAVNAAPDGSEMPPAQLCRALIAFGREQGRMVTALLTVLFGEEQARNAALPRSLLLELGAVFQIFIWEQMGIAEHLKPGLPTYLAASQDLADRVVTDLPAFDDPKAAVLSRRVLTAMKTQLSWGRIEAGEYVVVSDADEDAVVNAMASLLWRLSEL